MLSTQQENVINWGTTGRGSLNLVARAGCGKTFTLIELVKSIVKRNGGEIFLGAYNKKIADEISAKLTALGFPWQKVQAGTMHGAGFGAWRKVAPKVVVDDKKVDGIINTLIEKDANVEPFFAFIKHAVSLAKQRAFGVLCQIDDRSQWYDMVDHFGLDEDLEDGVDLDPIITLCIQVYKRSLVLDRDVIDYDDMILAPLYHNARMWPKDWVLIDEAQDTNPARRALAMKMLKPRTGRMVVVGDPAQAIYGFTGADSDSMDIIQAQLSSKVLPLNLTYRCPKSVVALAQQWVPDIQAHESAPEGIVRTIDMKEFNLEQLTADDVILCRNTKPLVDLAYNLLRRGIACRVEGRAIGEGLVKVIRRWKVRNISALLDVLPDYLERETQKWLAKGKEEKAANVADVVETITVLATKLLEEGKTTVDQLVSFINSLFGDTKEGETQRVLSLSTVHKSKGREWERVYLLGRNKYMPSRWARKDWQMAQEGNLCYVAVTRAKHELVEIVVEN